MAQRAALYIRVSTGKQKDNYSPETQRELGITYIGEHGYSLKPEHVFVEVYTAKDSADVRPEFNRMKKTIIDGEIDVVISLKADRMFRDASDGLLFLKWLRPYRCKLEFVQEAHDDTPTGRIMYGMKLLMAENHWEAIREASGRGRKARMESGKPLAGKKPLFGYRWEDERTKERLTIFEPEAEIVRWMYRHLAEGGSLASILHRFRAERRPGPFGGEWQATTLSRMIRNEGYTGRAFANRWETYKNERGGKNQRLRPREEWIPLPDGVFPAIVDSETWEKANQQIDRNRAKEGSRRLKNPEDFLLRNGYARCGICGQGMCAKNREGRPPTYQCARNLLAGESKHCTGTYINAAELDAAVWQRVRTVLTDPDWCKAYLAEQADTSVIDADLAAVEAELQDVAKRQKRLIGNLELVDEESAADIRVRLAELQTHKTRLQAEYHSINTRRANLKQAEDFIDRLIARSATVDSMTYQERRAILDEFGVKAIVYPASHPFRYEVDFAFEIDGLTVNVDGESVQQDGVTVRYSDYYGVNDPDMTGELLPGQVALGLPTS